MEVYGKKKSAFWVIGDFVAERLFRLNKDKGAAIEHCTGPPVSATITRSVTLQTE